MSPAQAVSYERRRSVRQNRVVLAVVATVKLCGGGTGANRRGIGEFRRATVTTRIRRRGEHGIRRPTIAQGRPSVRRHLYAAVRFPCATFSRSGPRVPVGTRSSLRPLQRRRATETSKTRAFGAARMPIRACSGKNGWCCQTGLNCRPLHYQWSALPLSYGSMCWDRIGRPRGLPSGPISATGLPAVQACKAGQDEKIGAISGVLRLFWPEMTYSPSILVPLPPPSGQLAPGADSTQFGFPHVGTIRAS